MEQENNTQSVETTATDVKVEKEVGKTFSQSDVDGIVGKIKSEEKAKRETLINEAVKSAISEYERKAKMSQEERENEAKSQREKDLAEREKNISLRERQIEAREMLANKGLSTDLVKFVVDVDADKMKANIDDLVKTYNKSVESSIQEKLKGQAPKDFSNTNKPVNNLPKAGTIF